MPGVRREAAPIMTRRRHRQIVERDAPRGRRAAGRHFDIDPPRLTVGLNPFSAQPAADLDPEMAHALPAQPFGGALAPAPLPAATNRDRRLRAAPDPRGDPNTPA